MRYTYIHGTIEKRLEWLLGALDEYSEKDPRSSGSVEAMKLAVCGSCANDPNHRYHRYLRYLIQKRLINPKILDYAMIFVIPRRLFNTLFNIPAGATVLGAALPFTRYNQENKSGAEALSVIFLWDMLTELSRDIKWYDTIAKLGIGSGEYRPLYLDMVVKGTIYHELVHAKQAVFDNKRRPPIDKDTGEVRYKNHLEIEAYAAQFEMEDAELGIPYNLEIYNAKNYREAALNHIKSVT